MNGITFSPIEFFMMAGPVGKGVMAVLLAASLWCWVIIIEGIVNVFRFRAALGSWRRGQAPRLLASVVQTGQAATDLRIPGETLGDSRHRITEAMNRTARGVVVALEGGLANLAVIASVAPFVGLFGTVWGIMTSFTSIAAAKDTSLAIVAPGIAEALATTAFGLAAAIPASVGYTRLGSAFGRCAQDLGSVIEEEALHAVSPATVVPRLHGLKEAV